MKKKVLAFTGLILSAALAFAAMTNFAPQTSVSAATTATATTPTTNIKAEDTTATWDAKTAKTIALNGTTATISGTGAVVKSGVVTITAAGTYVLNGKLTGQILVAAGSKDVVRLVLNGAEVTNPTSAAIYAKTCDKLIITLASGTKNVVTDGGDKFVYADATAEEPNAAIFSKSDLSINGTGTLTVNAGFNNDICTKDDLIIAGGTFNVTAANDGIKGKDSLTITGGTFTIKAGNDGIQSSNSTDAEKGWTIIQGGTFVISAAHDGMQAETQLNITGGTFTITSGGGPAAASPVSSGGGTATKTPAIDTSGSYKGLKSGGDLTITGGTFTLDCLDDGVHSNANVTIGGGTFTIASGDDGVHADGDLTVKGGAINVTKSYEGLEGNNVIISGGTITVVATDDGINAAGGNDGSGMGGRGFDPSRATGGDRFAGAPNGAADATSGTSHAIKISGGTTTVYSGSDGLDSNGAITVTGGTVCVFIYAPRDGEVLDADSTVTITPAIFGSAVVAGTKLSVTSGTKTLWSGTATNAATSYALIIPGLTNGTSYTVQAGTTSTTATVTTTAPRMEMGGGMGGDRQPGTRPGGSQKPGR